MQQPKVTSWTLFETWNKSIDLGREDRVVEPRDYIYASELGQSMIDRYLKMTGVAPTNPPNARSRRKFEAGNLWEWVLKSILLRAGILIDDQRRCEFQYPGMLSVHGRLDFIAGGKPDYERAKVEIKKMMLPEVTMRAAEEIVQDLQNRFPNGLKEITLELKSKGSMLYDRIEATGKAEPHHILQAFHYLKSQGTTEAHIVYLCRDDCRMTEIGVYNPSEVELTYKDDIKLMTYYILNKIQPEKEPLMTFNTDTFKFSKNWKVEYSPFLEMLYGYKDPMEYYEEYSKKAAQWNRVFKRCVDKAKMTPLNLEIIKDIEKNCPNFEELVEAAQKAGVQISDDEMEQSQGE